MVENGLEDKLGNDESVEKVGSSTNESDNSQKHFNNYVLCPLNVFFRGENFKFSL